MADGEVEVAVRAEGVDEAAAEMGGDGDGDGGGGGRGRGGDGLATAIKGGIVGGLISSALEPLLEVLDPFLQILQAFVAPLAVVLLRLFTPVLRLLIGLLPAYLDKFDEFETGIGAVLAALFPLAAFLPSIVNFVSKLPDKLDALPGKIKDFVMDLPGKIAAALNPVSGGGDSPPLLGRPRGRDSPLTAEETSERTGLPEPVSRIINISGGLAPFVSQITANANVDLESD
jgi:hypothetical protein